VDGQRFPFAGGSRPQSTSAVLKNALDYLYAEWNRKPVAFVSFGNTGGARAVEQLRAIAVELRMAPLGEAVHLLGVADKLRDGRFEADAKDKKQLAQLFDSLTWWGKALQTTRLGDAIAPNTPTLCSPSHLRGDALSAPSIGIGEDK
jgi:hypothetical protein